MKTVTIFGSSLPKEGEKEFQIAYKLGKELGKNGFNVCSGGYQGIMNAVSKGATEAGAEAIGITVDIFNAVPSKHLTKEIKCDSLFERIDKLISTGDAYVILNGGTGTLVELSVVWEYVNKGLASDKPVCCLGEMWQPIVEAIDKRMAYEGRKTGIVKRFASVSDCVEYLKSFTR